MGYDDVTGSVLVDMFKLVLNLVGCWSRHDMDRHPRRDGVYEQYQADKAVE